MGKREKGREREVSLPRRQTVSLPLQVVSMPTETLRLQEAPTQGAPVHADFLRTGSDSRAMAFKVFGPRPHGEGECKRAPRHVKLKFHKMTFSY